jgi:hypothetical protein
MKIQGYSFGKMEINGELYTNDLKIFPNKIKLDWWRKEGHLLQIEDIEDVFDFKPDLLIIGQGKSGRMKMSEKLKKKLEESYINYIAGDTAEVVKEFNKIKKEKVVGVFHLTC